jgi:hypothetical protein
MLQYIIKNNGVFLGRKVRMEAINEGSQSGNKTGLNKH